MYKFKMTIGDWSEDGHGKKETFLVESNYPVEKVREIHFAAPKVTGIDIESVCSNYDESALSDETIVKLEELEYSFNFFDEGFPIITPEEMFNIWAFLLKKTDPTLTLVICKEDYPEFHFYGFDDKSRHIGAIGYGLFI